MSTSLYKAIYLHFSTRRCEYCFAAAPAGHCATYALRRLEEREETEEGKDEPKAELGGDGRTDERTSCAKSIIVLPFIGRQHEFHR